MKTSSQGGHPARLSLAEAKRLLPIETLWPKLGLIGERPPLGRKFPSPFRPDRSPSCVLYASRDGGTRFADKSRGVDVDVIGFYALAIGVADQREACRQFLALAGGSGGASRGAFIRRAATSPPPPSKATAPGRPALPADLHRGDAAELARVAALRGLSVAGVALAGERGLLRFGRVCGAPCWLVLDGTGQLAQARRMDGRPFPATCALLERKAHTVKGSRQSWPLGLREAANFPAVLLVEGGPDLLAACHFIAQAGRERELAPVAMLGAGGRLPKEALPLFHGKRVRIFPHADLAGAGAAARWAWELEIEGRAAGPVDAFRFAGLTLPDSSPVNDLNDAARMHPTAQPEDLLP